MDYHPWCHNLRRDLRCIFSLSICLSRFSSHAHLPRNGAVDTADPVVLPIDVDRLVARRPDRRIDGDGGPRFAGRTRTRNVIVDRGGGSAARETPRWILIARRGRARRRPRQTSRTRWTFALPAVCKSRVRIGDNRVVLHRDYGVRLAVIRRYIEYFIIYICIGVALIRRVCVVNKYL